jgi:hypothetical protein
MNQSKTDLGIVHESQLLRFGISTKVGNTMQISDGLSPGGGRHHFFAATSFSMALSSIASASSFFSFAFSSSSAFSRLASETSSPPYLAFHL